MIFMKRPKRKSKEIDTSHLTKVGASVEAMTRHCDTALPALERLIRDRVKSMDMEKCVFIVEDDPKAIESMKKSLQDNGIRYHYAQDIHRALQDVGFLNPKILIIDNSIPDFEEMIERHGSQTILLTVAPRMVPDEVRDKVLAVFDKAKILDLVKYLKTMFGYAGPLENGGETA